MHVCLLEYTLIIHVISNSLQLMQANQRKQICLPCLWVLFLIFLVSLSPTSCIGRFTNTHPHACSQPLPAALCVINHAIIYLFIYLSLFRTFPIITQPQRSRRDPKWSSAARFPNTSTCAPKVIASTLCMDRLESGMYQVSPS